MFVKGDRILECRGAKPGHWYRRHARRDRGGRQGETCFLEYRFACHFVALAISQEEGRCEVAWKISGFALAILAFSYSNKVSY